MILSNYVCSTVLITLIDHSFFFFLSLIFFFF
ncbi:hypothetical protein ACJIZ3_024339 [Penstemon smallii]|uniref:Uncharacterized protein n=1 Tax=Penstemon smallii TaxID=265156 RepID=A0ABD3TUP3_9LAMI